MYKCNTCDSEYSSQKKYLKHLDVCGIDTKSTNSLALTDVEDELSYGSNSRSRSQRSVVEVNSVNTKIMIEKLVKDKARYKAELKSIKKHIDSQQYLNKNNGQFLNQQLLVITEERDDLLEQVEHLNSNDAIIKEKLRIEFSKKLSQEKTKIIENYNIKELDNSKIKHVLAMLETKLENSNNEKEQIKLSLETEMRLLSSKFNSQLQQLHSENEMVKNNIQQERLNYKKQIELMKDEKFSELNNLKKQKDEEIEITQFEKINTVNILEDKLKTIEKENVDMKKSYESIILNDKTKYDIEITQLTKDNEKINNNYLLKCEQQNELSQGQLIELSKNHENEKNSMEIIHENEIKNIHQEYQIKNNNVVSSLKEELLNLTKDNKSMLILLEENKSNSKKEVETNNIKYNDNLKELNVNHQKQIEIIKQNIVKEHINEISLKNTEIDNLMVANREIGNKTNNLQEILKNMEKDSITTREEFVFNLNEQLRKHEMDRSELMNQNKELRQNLDSLSLKIEKLKNDQQLEIIRVCKSSDNYKEELHKTQVLLDESHGKNQNLQKNSLQLMKQQEEIHNKLLETSTQKTILEVQSKSHEEIVSKYKRTTENIEKKLENRQIEAEKRNDKYNDLKVKLMENETFLKGTTSELEMSKNINQKYDLKNKELLKRNEEISIENEDFRKKIFEIKNENSLLAQNISLIDQKYNQLRVKYSTSLSINDKLDEEVRYKNTLEKNCKERDNEISTLKKKLEYFDDIENKNKILGSNLEVLHVKSDQQILEKEKMENNLHQVKQENQAYIKCLTDNSTKIKHLSNQLQQSEENFHRVCEEKEDSLKKISDKQKNNTTT